MAKFFPIRLIPEKTKINFMEIKNFNFFISILLIIISFAFICFKGFNLGIDFKGGIIIEARFNKTPDISHLKKIIHGDQIHDVTIQSFDLNNFAIKLSNNSTNKNSASQIVETIKQILTTEFGAGEVEFRKIDYVGPQVGSELIKNAVIAIILALLAIMSYIAFRFQWQFSLGIVIALLHDIFFTLGMISITNLEFNLNTIAALLTIIGYSVNDSVVIYDRIRENIKKYKKITIYDLINLSTNETLSRTTLTVLTTLIAALSLIIFGGPTLYSFSIVVFFGILIGTYSSIYVSSPILIHLGLEKYQR